MALKRIVVEVVDVTGRCVAGLRPGAVWEITENVTIMGENICYFAVSSLMPVLLALQLGNEPKDVGLSKEKGVAYLRCSDIGDPLTPGGCVTFRVKRKYE